MFYFRKFKFAGDLNGIEEEKISCSFITYCGGLLFLTKEKDNNYHWVLFLVISNCIVWATFGSHELLGFR